MEINEEAIREMDRRRSLFDRVYHGWITRETDLVYETFYLYRDDVKQMHILDPLMLQAEKQVRAKERLTQAMQVYRNKCYREKGIQLTFFHRVEETSETYANRIDTMHRVRIGTTVVGCGTAAGSSSSSQP